MSVATPRVLVVSESRITRRVVEMTFADQPLQLVAFTTAAAAAGELRTRPPSALLADIALQGSDGYELARLLRAHPDGQKAVTILLAGQTETVDEAAAAAAQVSAILRKPLDSHQLVDAVRQALRAGPPAPAVAAEPAPVLAFVEASKAVEDAPTVDITPPVEVAADEAAATLPQEDVAPEPLASPTSELAAEPAPVMAAASSGGDGLADTFHALLEVEQGIRPALAPALLDEHDVERVATRVAALVAADGALASRLEAAVVDRTAPTAAAAAERAAGDAAPALVAGIVERVVRELAPAMVEQVAHAVVRDEIARLRGTARVA